MYKGRRKWTPPVGADGEAEDAVRTTAAQWRLPRRSKDAVSLHIMTSYEYPMVDSDSVGPRLVTHTQSGPLRSCNRRRNPLGSPKAFLGADDFVCDQGHG